MHLRRPNSMPFLLVLHYVFLSVCCSLLTLSWTALASAQSPVPAVAGADTDAAAWQQNQLAELGRQLAAASDQATATELRARTAWLQAWQPGRMDRLDAFEPEQHTLRSEPDLTDLRGQVPEAAEPALQRAIDLQQRLRRLDAVDVRKDNLHETVAVGEQLVHALQSIPRETLNEKSRGSLKWAIAFTLYRQARALGYQELPDVVQRQPIDDPEALDRRLRQVHAELTSVFDESQPEFVLLDVRMLRRDENYGRALQLLERHRATILGKWYLKKRRDLLEELGWVPPWKEAASIYRESGLASGEG